MTSGIALWHGNAWDLGWGQLHYRPDSVLELSPVEGDSVQMNALETSPFVEVFLADTWFCAVGATEPEIFIGRGNGASLDVIGTVERQDNTSIGSHVLRFHPCPRQDQVLFSWEQGIGLIDAAQGLLWTYLHLDEGRNFVRMVGDTVEISSRNLCVSVTLSDGLATVQDNTPQLAVGSEILDEWQQSIGR